MEKSSAIRIIKNTFEKPFDKEQYRRFIKELFNHLDESNNFFWAGNRIPNAGAFQPFINSIERVGKYQDTDGKKIDCLIVNLKKETSLEYARTSQRNFVARYLQGYMGGDDKDAALVAFVSSPDSKDWRFSLVKVDYGFDSGKLKTELTPARRYSFLVGENESSHTAQLQLLPILQEDRRDPLLNDFEEAFSVEIVTKEFFTKYRELYHEVEEALQDVINKDVKVQNDFKDKGVDTVNFAKKLLGQIVFLYFLQKKGWFGVPRKGEWGQGSKNFLRELFEKKHGDYRNFFNDILELLFYDALRRDRSEDDHYYPHFNCKIPFLNGGLFDPMNDYNWVDTEILLPNELFSNKNKTKEGDTGTGILDVFDRYNFTVKEDEPLDKEVAVDPEMLGKVFENLLEVKDRKSKGTYYTPREIVHYMCQESLINYLDTTINSGAVPLAKENPVNLKLLGAPATQQMSMKADGYTGRVPREDIETLVRMGELAVEHDARVESTGKETKDYAYKLPASIRLNAALIDNALADIRVCDPAIGSGAFPVGLMSEIVRARDTLTTYLSDKEGRTKYNFKRHAIQICLYGVDIDPSAVEIAKLRLWLSLVVDEEDIKKIQPLPNLDYKIVCGNSLLNVERNMFNNDLFQRLEELKPMYFNETNAKRKLEFRKQIDQLINKLTNDNKIFDFEVYFSEVFHEKSGFNVVISNPPYNELRDLTLKEQDSYRNSVHYNSAHGGRDNLFQFFYPLAINISKKSGVVCLITQNSILAEDTTLTNRRFIITNSKIIRFVSFPERDDVKKRVFENAKMSVCIGILEATKCTTTDYDFCVDVWYDRYFSAGHTLQLNLSEIQSIYPAKLIFPISTELAFKLLKKIKGQKETFHVEAKSGEIDMTKFSNRFNLSKIGYRVFTGAQILRYRTTDNPSQGDVIYLDAGLGEFSSVKRTHIANERIVMQRITGVDSDIRLIMTIIQKNNFCANSTNYISDNDGQNLRYILAILNSALINYLFKQTSTNTNITTDEINAIPLPKATASIRHHLAVLADQILNTAKETSSNSAKQTEVKDLEYQIDQMVYQLYGLTPEEINSIEKA